MKSFEDIRIAKIIAIAVSVLLFLAPIAEVTGTHYINVGIKLSFPNVVTMLLFVLMFIDILLRHKLPRHMLYALFVTMMAIWHSVFLTAIHINEMHSKTTISMIGGLMLLLAFTYWFRIDKHADIMRWAFIITAVILCLGGLLLLLGVVQLTVEQAKENLKLHTGRITLFGIGIPRNSGLSGLPMGAFGSYCEVGAFMLASLGLRGRSRKVRHFLIRLLCILLAVVISGFSLIMTQSRSQLLALVFGATVFFTLSFFEKSKNGRINRALTAVFLISVGLIAGVFIWPYIVNVGEQSVDHRTGLYGLALIEILSSPILGNGYHAVNAKYEYGIVHNHFIAHVLGLGVVTAGLYFSLFFKSAINGIRYLVVGGTHSSFVIAAMAGAGAVFIELCLYSGIFSPINLIMLGILLTIARPAIKYTQATQGMPAYG